MKNKITGSFYPNCNSKKTSFLKNECLDGIIFINNGNLVFQRMILLCFKTKTKIIIPLKNIEKVENYTLNGFLPYGVCVFTKDSKEYMFGHVKSKKLQDFIMNARAGMVNKISDENLKKHEHIRKISGILIGIFIVLLVLISLIIGYDTNQKNIVLAELETINNLDSYEENIDMNIKADRYYAKIELAIKEYYSDFFNNSNIFYDNCAESLFNIFTPSYLKENKSKLKKLKLYDMINIKTKELDIAIENINQMLTEEKIMSYISKYQLTDYYTNFYRQNMVSENDLIYQKRWQKLKESNTIKIKYLKEVVDILINYNNKWYIENDNIYFTDNNLLEKYNNLYELIYKEEETENTNISDLTI